MTDHPHPQPPFELASQQLGPLPIVDTALPTAKVIGDAVGLVFELRRLTVEPRVDALARRVAGEPV